MRTLKIVGIALGSLIVLLILLLIAAALLINPNNYRSRIEAAAQQSTGRSLMLSGNLHLRVFPTIALRFGPASLSNPPGFPSAPFLTLQQASLSVGLLPLLHGQLQIGHIEIDGMDARLLRDTQGRGNWQTPSTARATSSSRAAPAGASQPTTLPQVAGLTLRDARVSYNDLVLDHINLTVGQIAEGVAVPVNVQLQVQRPAPAQPLDLTGSLTLTDQPDALRISALDVQLDQSRLRGRLSLVGQSNQSIDFNLNIDRFDLDRYRTVEPKAAAATPPASSPMPLPTSILGTLRMDGSLTLGTLRLDGITLTQVVLHAAASDGVAHLAPISAHLYDGVYSGDVTLNAKGAVPVMMTTQTLQNIDMGKLLQDFARTQRLTGKGNLTAMLTGQGADTGALLRTLGGRVVIDLNQGAVEGIDLPFEVQRAEALIRRSALPGGRGTGRTNFQTFHASADVHDGVATTKDLDIATQLARVRGQGTLNLVTNAVNYQLQVALLNGAPATPAATAGTLAEVPLNITGTVDSPQVRPDLQQLAKTQLQQQLQKQLKQQGGQMPQQVQSVLKGLFGGGSGKK